MLESSITIKIVTVPPELPLLDHGRSRQDTLHLGTGAVVVKLKNI